MLGPYTANKDRTISYKGNRVFSPIADVSKVGSAINPVEERVTQFRDNPMWGNIARINHRMNMSVNEYFDNLGAVFTTLPLTTRMISSPGAVYGREAINYTTDTCPITLRWFNLPREAFLSESSQIYLELALMQKGIDQAYSVYNSFRKERADATHLSEFHHVEYEGKMGQRDNEGVALGLVGKVVQDLLDKNESDLAKFLEIGKMNRLEELARNIQNIPRITYKEAQEALFADTGDERYKRFTMQDNFGSWEEVRLTEIFGGMVAIREFPLLEVPFYHAKVDGVEHEYATNIRIPRSATSLSGFSVDLKPQIMEVSKKSFVADNTDIIWPGYRETIGSGHRVRSKAELEEKAKIFNLPREDYQPYLQSRDSENYVETSGFGLGWERMVQGLLEMPCITEAVQFPRIDTTLKP